MLNINQKFKIKDGVENIIVKTIGNHRTELYLKSEKEIFEVMTPIELLVIVDKIEKHFSCSFDDRDLVYDNFTSIENLVKLVENYH